MWRVGIEKRHFVSAPEHPQSNPKKAPARKPADTRKVKGTHGSSLTRQSAAWLQLKPLYDITGLSAHDLVIRGISVKAAKQVIGAFQFINEAHICSLLGVDAKTMQHRSAKSAKTLDPNASDRALRLVSVTNQAIGVLGSQEAAERWLSRPAMGLESRKPIELLRSTEGSAMVRTLLTRMDYGIYA